MTQQIGRVRVILPTTNANQDNVSFDLTVEATGSDTGLPFSAGSSTNVVDMINTFLNTVTAPSTHTLANYIAQNISRAAGACSVEMYDVTAHLDGSSAGPPVGISTFTLAASAAQADMPIGMAAPIGIRADYGTDIEHGVAASLPTPDRAQDEGAPATYTGITRPRARDRGRFFLGPLNFACLAGTPGDGAKWAPAFVTDLGGAVKQLLQTHNSGAHDQFNVVIWSRRAAGVKTALYYGLSDYPGYQRRRTDEMIARVHNWTHA